MRFAYADPPYIGQAKKHYSHDPNHAEVDHRDLVTRLCKEWPDGWALSLSCQSLQTILSFCPEEVRIAAWCKPMPAHFPTFDPTYAWEPVIFLGGRKQAKYDHHVLDWLKLNPNTNRNGAVGSYGDGGTRKKSSRTPGDGGIIGAKPEMFCVWITRLLHSKPEDEWDDLFPGTGAFTSSWERNRSQGRLF